MKTLTKYSLSLCVVCIAVIVGLSVKPAFAAEPDSDGTCSISVTVSPVMEWAGNFTAISLTAINAYSDTPEDNEAQTIYTNCNFNLDADQTAAAQLEVAATSDTLITNYKLTEDGDGVATTGATDADCTTSGTGGYLLYSAFLDTVLPITHVDNDGAVVITLYVQATNPSGEMADQGSYTAIQTLTAVWTSD
ncbi:hypothetical protein ACFL3G_12830 [Planctomycetota bacterium]